MTQRHKTPTRKRIEEIIKPYSSKLNDGWLPILKKDKDEIVESILDQYPSAFCEIYTSKDSGRSYLRVYKVFKTVPTEQLVSIEIV